MPNDEDAPGTAVSEQRTFPESLCWRCANHREVKTTRSVFVMCTVLPVKYPRQPVASCAGFRPGD